MSYVRLSKKSAKALSHYFANVNVADRLLDPAIVELRDSLVPRKPKSMRTERFKVKRSKKATKRERRSDVRAAVKARANGVCECGCGKRTDPESFMFKDSLDHFWGKARAESVESCWSLAEIHHERKTMNFPSRAEWLEKWIAHCSKHGYSREAAKARRELEAEALVQKAADTSGVKRV